MQQDVRRAADGGVELEATRGDRVMLRKTQITHELDAGWDKDRRFGSSAGDSFP